MEIGMIGLGRMGANMATRLLRAGHRCVVYDPNPQAVQALAEIGAEAAPDLVALCDKLARPRALWLMVPAAVVGSLIDQLLPYLDPEDVLIDGGNSHYQDAIRRAERLTQQQIHFLDCGTSGGVWGLERGYCLMIGGEASIVKRLEPIFQSLAPGADPASTPAEQGYLHCGPSGAGHFVKMIHNGIEYALMAAYAEGFNLLKRASIGREEQVADAETAPLGHPEYYRYQLDLPQIAELWRHGSVISSWLLDLTAAALRADPQLEGFSGRVSDSGEGRWTCMAAIETGTPAPLLTAALYERFASRGEASFANQLLSAMRYQFGGHREKDQ